MTLNGPNGAINHWLMVNICAVILSMSVIKPELYHKRSFLCICCCCCFLFFFKKKADATLHRICFMVLLSD